jgi:hypothetical protein
MTSFKSPVPPAPASEGPAPLAHTLFANKNDSPAILFKKRTGNPDESIICSHPYKLHLPKPASADGDSFWLDRDDVVFDDDFRPSSPAGLQPPASNL